ERTDLRQQPEFAANTTIENVPRHRIHPSLRSGTQSTGYRLSIPTAMWQPSAVLIASRPASFQFRQTIPQFDERTPRLANFAHAPCSDAEISLRPASSFSSGFTDLRRHKTLRFEPL